VPEQLSAEGADLIVPDLGYDQVRRLLEISVGAEPGHELVDRARDDPVRFAQRDLGRGRRVQLPEQCQRQRLGLIRYLRVA
jgi:hypothetical protein